MCLYEHFTVSASGKSYRRLNHHRLFWPTTHHYNKFRLDILVQNVNIASVNIYIIYMMYDHLICFQRKAESKLNENLELEECIQEEIEVVEK